MINVSYVILGLAMGILSGFLGIGGGIILIPALVYFYGLTQHQAQGTSLAVMVPPITLLAALRYYYNGNVKIGITLLIACGFALGGLLGANMAQYIPTDSLKKIFGIVLLCTSIKMIFF